MGWLRAMGWLWWWSVASISASRRPTWPRPWRWIFWRISGWSKLLPTAQRQARSAALNCRRRAPQHGVAVRIAPEARNDVAVRHLELQVVFQPRLIKQHHRLGVDGGGFAVHVGHVGKGAFGGGQCLVVLPGHQLLRQGQRLGVLRKRKWRAAVDVARELVQHQDLCQAALGRAAPVPQLALPRCPPAGTEADTDHRVDGVLLCKVLGGGEFFEPEMKDVFGLHREYRMK